MHRCRKRIAGWVMLGWLFAQIVTVAHACPVLTPAAQGPITASAAVASPMPGDCAAMAVQAGSNADVCQSHCIGGEQVGSDLQTPSPALAPQVALAVRAVAPAIPTSASLHARPPHCAGPPATLLFSRFLI